MASLIHQPTGRGSAQTLARPGDEDHLTTHVACLGEEVKKPRIVAQWDLGSSTVAAHLFVWPSRGQDEGGDG